MRLKNIDDVVEARLCCGCGACAYMSPEKFAMVDVESQGRRPRRISEGGPSQNVMAVCPGIGLSHPSPATLGQGYVESLLPAWGPILQVWEGYAADPEIRYSGSSGGAVTALALYCIEAGGMPLVLHTAGSRDQPHLNETVVSRCRDELMRTTGSRYAPASPCEGLRAIEEAEGPSVFVGKPCDVAAVQKARRLRPDLDRNIGITIAFFCAGTPSTRGTLELLERMGVEDTKTLVSLRYRGDGWPGKATAIARAKDGKESVHQFTYEESWGGILAKHQQWRCKICADHTGEFADIAVGDPWYRSIAPDEPGRSMIIARTERGRMIVHAAARAGFLEISEADPDILPASQQNLLRTRGAIWGRILAIRLMRGSAPVYQNMPTFRHWWMTLTVREKFFSVFGAILRIRRQNRERQN